jgi:nucleotide-binding universal stress UspA family protein
MFKKILVAYDNGSKAKKALDIAIDMAKGNNAEIHLVSSSKMTEFVSQVASPKILDDLEKQSRAYVEEMLQEPAEKVRAAGLPVYTVILQERPGEGILKYAEKEGLDLIVMGSANRPAVERFFLGLGSVSNYVLQRAKIPVLIIKD